jgi:hypothetical protein
MTGMQVSGKAKWALHLSPHLWVNVDWVPAFVVKARLRHDAGMTFEKW